MNKYQIICINKKEYYLANDIYDFDKSYFYGCSGNVRTIIDKKEIDDKDYMFAYKKNNGWIISSIKYFKAKLLLSKEWCENNVPNFSEDKNIRAEYEKLPPIVELEDDQKFIDYDGNKYDITVRGERDPDKCYFEVNDVSEIFEMKSLKTTLVDNRGAYLKHKHYKYFMESNLKILYVTYLGFAKLIMSIESENQLKLLKWINMIVYPEIKNEKIIINKIDKDTINKGFIYAVEAPLFNGIKVGFSKRQMKSQKKRYTTPFTKNIKLYYVAVNDCVMLEKKFQKKFIKYNIDNEVFDKSYLNKYIEFMGEHGEVKIYY